MKQIFQGSLFMPSTFPRHGGFPISHPGPREEMCDDPRGEMDIHPRVSKPVDYEIFGPGNLVISSNESTPPPISPPSKVSSELSFFSSSMAATLSLEWPLDSNPRRSLSSFPTTTLFSISIPRPLPVPSPTARRLLILCSAGSSSSLLEEASNELHRIQFRSKPASLTPSSISDINVTGIFVERLEKKPRTESDFDPGYYRKARLQPGFRLDQGTLRILVKQLLKSKNWTLIPDLADDIRSSRVFPDKATCGRLVSGCIRARKFKNAELLLGVFGARKGVAVAALGAALRGYNKLHMYSSSVLVYDRMMAAGVLLDSFCYFYVMGAYSKLFDVDKVVSLFQEFESKKLECSPELLARVYFILCDTLGKSGRAFQALRYFREMTEKGILPNSSLYSSLVCSFAGINEAEIAEDLLQEARDNGPVKDPAVFLKLVLMYVEVGLTGKTLEIVKVMREMGLRVSDCILCAVVNGHVKKQGLRASVMAYEQMMSLGCVPGQVTYASIINVYYRLGLLGKAEKTFEEMLERGFHKCVVAYSNMVSMYSKAGRVRDAMRLLAKMKEKGCQPNVWVYNSLIDMHGRLMNLRQVEKLWKEMKRKKIEPDKVSYTSIICAYSKVKEFDKCAVFYEEFRSNGGKLDRIMAGIMVGVFSKMSSIEELLKLLQRMKLEGVQLDERLYMSSLNALRDASLQGQVKWFRETFAYVKSKENPVK